MSTSRPKKHASRKYVVSATTPTVHTPQVITSSSSNAMIDTEAFTTPVHSTTDRHSFCASPVRPLNNVTKMKPRSIRCMKFFLTLFNIICVLFGLVLMGICVMNMRERKTGHEQSALSRGVLSFLLTLGLALVVTAILGCIGALREHVRILYVHACFFIFLVSVELIVGVGGAVISAWVGGGSELRVQFYKNVTSDEEVAKHHAFWDHLQFENQCCGVDGPQDYAILHRDIPPACCSRAHPLRDGGARKHIHATCLADRTYYMRGCEDALRQKKAVKGNIFISTGVIFALIEVFCIILAFWMARTIRSERRKLQQNLQAHFET